jgi:hypothetical protein
MYGDTAAAGRRVGQLREQAGDIRALADRLVGRAEAVPWHGRAAEAMRQRIKDRAAHLRAAAEAHDVAADSLAKHLGDVDDVKETIEQRQRRATSLLESGDVRAPAGFTPPPDGHKDWLDVTLPGL